MRREQGAQRVVTGARRGGCHRLDELRVDLTQPHRLIDELLARVEAVVDEVLATPPENLREMHVPRRLGRLFAEASGNLVLVLIINGLRTQIPEPKRTLGFPPKIDPASLKRIATDLKAAVNERDPASAGASMRELIGLIRAAVRDNLSGRAPQAKEARS